MKTMKRTLVFAAVLCACFASPANAQKFALIDMEFILQNIPAYQSANEQLEQLSNRRQAEVDASMQQAQALYKNYQAVAKTLSEAQRTKKEEEVVAKEKETAELRRKYFGPEGELAKARDSLMKPIQDNIYEAVKELAEAGGYAVVTDRASASSIIYASPRIDISRQVLTKMGYSINN